MGRIRVDPRTGVTYLPKEIRRDGFTGEVEFIRNALTLTLIKPGVSLADAEKSLNLILQDIALRMQHEATGGKKPRKLPTAKARVTPQHPVFIKYKRGWLGELTGYSEGYLCRVATGSIPLSRPFVERVCFKLKLPEAELFLPEASGEGEK